MLLPFLHPLIPHFSPISRLPPRTILGRECNARLRPLYFPTPRRSFHAVLLLPSLLVATPPLYLPSFVVPHCPRSPSLPPSLPHPSLVLAAPSDFLHPPSRPRRVPFAPSLIYCITVHEVANLRRVILYKYVSQINIRATTICIRTSRR